MRVARPSPSPRAPYLGSSDDGSPSPLARSHRRDAALRSLLGDNYVEVAFLREPIERALSGYYYIAMNARRSAAVRNVRAPGASLLRARAPAGSLSPRGAST